MMFDEYKQAQLKKNTYSIYILQALIFVSGGYSWLMARKCIFNKSKKYD
jgi:hypothetical protein